MLDCISKDAAAERLLAGIGLLTLLREPSERQINLATATSPIHDPTIERFEDAYYIYSSSALGSFYRSHRWQASGADLNRCQTGCSTKYPKPTTRTRYLITKADTCCSISRIFPIPAMRQQA